MTGSHFRAHRPWLALLGGLLLAAAFLQGPASSRAQSCITTLPLKWSLSSYYAASWKKTVDVTVQPQGGVTLRGLSITISTFKGAVLGQGSGPAAFGGTTTIPVKLKYAMQPGRFSLYFYGYPNSDPSCGPKHLGTTVRMTGCVGSLGVKILDPPEGNAASYGNYYSFEVEPERGALYQGLAASLSTYSGQVVGKTTIKALFGRLRVSIPLRAGIQPEPTEYTLDVSGFPDGRPAVCGAAQARKTLKFH